MNDLEIIEKRFIYDWKKEDYDIESWNRCKELITKEGDRYINLDAKFVNRIRRVWYSKSTEEKLSESFEEYVNDKPRFYVDIKRLYLSQTEEGMRELKWVNDDAPDKECRCYYCGTSESTLNELYHNGHRTKRNRGKWFEVDRRDTAEDENIYNRDNMVLACYFCNNHKSDVISSTHMRDFFGEKMYQYLMNMVELLALQSTP